MFFLKKIFYHVTISLMIVSTLLKISPIRKIIYLLGKRRAKNIVGRILPFLEQCQTIIDIGSGTGNITELLIKNGKKVTPVDIRNLSVTRGIVPILYEGEKIPFPNGAFDAALLICVLHHAKNNENILQEAKRVAKKIIIIEDIYTGKTNKLLINFFDNFFNFEFFKNPHSNKTDKEWKELFNNFNLRLESFEYYRSLLVFHHVLYSLTRR